MRLEIRRTAHVELSLKEAAIIQQAKFIAKRDHPDWQGLELGEDGPNGVSHLGISIEEIQTCKNAFDEGYIAVKSEDMHDNSFKATHQRRLL